MPHDLFGVCTYNSFLWQSRCHLPIEGFHIPQAHQTHQCSFSFHSSNSLSQSYWATICPTNDMIANIFMKPLARFKFEKFHSLLGVSWSCVHLEGECRVHTLFNCSCCMFYLFYLHSWNTVFHSVSYSIFSYDTTSVFDHHWGVSPIILLLYILYLLVIVLCYHF